MGMEQICCEDAEKQRRHELQIAKVRLEEENLVKQRDLELQIAQERLAAEKEKSSAQARMEQNQFEDAEKQRAYELKKLNVELEIGRVRLVGEEPMSVQSVVNP